MLGRHAAGGRAGLLVMLISSTIWIAASIATTLLVRADGTLSGVFTSAFAGGDLTTELVALLIQEVIAALFGLGVGALAGKIGEASARTQPQRAAASPPPFAIMPYPPYPGMQTQAPPPNWMPYPPPPSYYHPYPGPQHPTGERATPPPSETTNGL